MYMSRFTHKHTHEVPRVYIHLHSGVGKLFRVPMRLLVHVPDTITCDSTCVLYNATMYISVVWLQVTWWSSTHPQHITSGKWTHPSQPAMGPYEGNTSWCVSAMSWRFLPLTVYPHLLNSIPPPLSSCLNWIPSHSSPLISQGSCWQFDGAVCQCGVLVVCHCATLHAWHQCSDTEPAKGLYNIHLCVCLSKFW